MRQNKFKPGLVASLFNSLKTHVFKTGGVGIVSNRDGRLGGLVGNGTNNADIALDILADPHAQSCYDRLLEIMSYATPNIEPGGDKPIDKEAAEFIKEKYIDRHREIIIESLALAKITGCAAHENNYARNRDGKIFVKNVVPVDPDRMVYSIKENAAESELRIITFNSPFEGEVPPSEKIVDYTYFSVYINNPYGFGVGSQLVDIINYKERMLELWVKIAERYSTPIKIGRLPDTAEDEEVDAFFEHFKNMSENSIFMLPPGFELDVVDVSATGADSLLKSLIEYCDERISTLLLGENLTGREIANGAQARDSIASKISERKALSLLGSIANRLNETTITWLTKMNFAGAEPPILSFTYEESLEKLGQRLTVAKQLNINMDEEAIAEMLKVPLSTEPTPGLGDRAGK